MAEPREEQAGTGTLGFIGLGRMGAPMCGRLLEAGHAVAVFDTDAAAIRRLADRGAVPAASPREVADRAQTILLSLPTAEIVQRVALGPDGIAGGSACRTVIDLSTIGPKGAEALAEGLAAHGIATIDAPVSGGVTGAEKGSLAVMAAGAPEVLAAIRPVLERFGRVFAAGPRPGMGQAVKIINNLMSVTALAIASEALVLGRAAGLDPDTLIEIVNASSGRSNASEDKIPRFVLPRSFDFGFALELSNKDTRLCMELAEELDMPMVVGSAARQMLKIALATQGPAADLTSLIRPIEDWMGVVVAGRAAGRNEA